MKSNKYTLDRYEGEVGVLLLKGDESQELLVPKDKLDSARQGDILLLETEDDNEIKNVTILLNETDVAWKKAKDLLEILKNKN